VAELIAYPEAPATAAAGGEALSYARVHPGMGARPARSAADPGAKIAVSSTPGLTGT
jgi:hypothetical protein